MTEADTAEFDTVFSMLVAERESDRTPRLNVVQLGLLRHVARLTISDDPKDAKILADLLPLAPPVISPGRLPPPTLEQMDRDDAELDISRLNNEQLMRLEELHAVMRGAACPRVDTRVESGLALAWCDPSVEVSVLRDHIVRALPPGRTLEDVQPTYRAELDAEHARRRALEDENKRLEHALALASRPLPANVASLAAARAEREAPTMSSPPALR